MTADQFRAQERQRALDHAPFQELNEAQFRRLLSSVAIPALRQAGIRWSADRGRSRATIIDGIVQALQNPNVNQGDSFRLALGHVRACEIQIKRAG